MEKEYAELSDLKIDYFVLGSKKQMGISILGTVTCYYIKKGKQEKLQFKKVRGGIGLTKANIQDLIKKLREAGYIKREEIPESEEESIKEPFIISCFVDDDDEFGFPQKFKFDRGDLYVLVLLDKNDEFVKQWVQATKCKCREILSMNLLEEMMKKDGVTPDNLRVIEDFEWKYKEAKGG
jgi:DNA-binding Lrp family transcriptional regulator